MKDRNIYMARSPEEITKALHHWTFVDKRRRRVKAVDLRSEPWPSISVTSQIMAHLTK